MKFALIVVGLAMMVRIDNSVLPNAPIIKLPPEGTEDALLDYTDAGQSLLDGQAIPFAADGRAIPPLDARLYHLSPWYPTNIPPDYTAKKRLVAENLLALTKLREALAQPYYAPQGHTFETLLPDADTDKRIANLLALLGQLSAAHRMWTFSMTECIDSIMLSAETMQGARSSQAEQGMDEQQISYCMAQGVVHNLGVADSLADAHKLETIDEHEVSAADILNEDKLSTQVCFVNDWKSRNWDEFLTVIAYRNPDTLPGADIPDWSNPSTWESRVLLPLQNPRTGYDEYTAAMNQLVATSRLPWPQQLTAPMPHAVTGVCADILQTPPINVSFDSTLILTQNRLLECQLALHAYQLEHGFYPLSLANLVPRYISRPPIDPFSDNVLLRYRRIGGQYLLYSIGPDARDDGGKNMNDIFLQNSTALHNKPVSNMLGDIVVASGN